MEIGSIDRTDGNSLADTISSPERLENGRAALTVVRQLRALNVNDREFTVVRDPESHKFVVHVIDRSTGVVLDQFPPEKILKMLSQLQGVSAEQQQLPQEGQTQA
jgi:hypothetical protein